MVDVRIVEDCGAFVSESDPRNNVHSQLLVVSMSSCLVSSKRFLHVNVKRFARLGISALQLVD